jgi:hypothetical protein
LIKLPPFLPSYAAGGYHLRYKSASIFYNPLGYRYVIVYASKRSFPCASS